MESKWLDTTNALPSMPFTQPASGMENQGSGDYSSLPSSSSTSSERNQSSGSAVTDVADDTVSAMLKDDDVRAMLKKVTVNEGVLNKAIQSLGGGEKGLKGLMGYIMLWVKHQRESKASSQAEPPSQPSFNFSGDAAPPQPGSDTFQILSGILQPTTSTQALPVKPQDMQHHFQRFKSRRLMMGEPEIDTGLGVVDTGFCPSNFMSVNNLGEYSSPKPEMASPGVMAPCIPYPHGMPQQPVMQQPMLPFTTGMPSVEQTPAMTTRAARRHRMARQRQSMMNHHHARAASSQASPVPGSSAAWNTAPPAVAMKRPGMPHSGAAQAPHSTPATAARKGRNVESLTLLLQKELRPSDVGNLGRIILPKKEAEQHMPSLAMRGGVSIRMEDYDSGHTWNLRYSVTPPPKMGSSPVVTSSASSFWPNNKSRMYLLENTGEFVRAHRLVEGDLLLLYRSQQGAYVLRGKKKKTQRLELEPAQAKFAHSSAKVVSAEEPTSPKEHGMLVSRLYGGGGPPEKCVKEEPVTPDEDDLFLKDMMLNMGPSFGSDSSCLQRLERFPSLNLDFPLDEIMAATTTTTKAEPEG